ncbi:MAG: gliding motility-associated C-terminal domain-containing protein [Saprospiraceae bacterium]
MSLPTSIRYIILGALIIWSNMANACFIQMVSEEIICNGSSVTLSPIVSPAGGTFSWSTGETTPTITVSPGFSTSYTLTYTNGPCVVSKTVNVIVSIANDIDDTGIAVCTDENGNGLANLLNTGLVTFWEDAGATIPITNPGAHPVQITGTWDTVYATVGNPPCYDLLYNVLLCKHKQIDQSEFVISQFPEQLCELPNGVSVIYTLPQSLFTDLCPGFAFTSFGTQSGYPGNPWISTNGFAYPFGYQNGSGTFSFSAFSFINVEQDITISFDDIYYYSSNCLLVDFEPNVTFVIETNLINLSVNDLTTCAGSSVDLNTLASTTSTFPISFHSSASASAASLITSPYIVNSSQTIYAKITNTNPFCENIKAIDITVLPNVQVNVSDGEVCQNQGLNLSNLTVSPPSPGIWSGNGISNNVFTSPTPGTFNLTFTPSTQCYLADDVAIEVLPQPTISLGASTICDISGIFQLSDIQDPAFSAGQWSGINVSNGAFDPSGLQGNYTLTFTPASQYVCAQPATTQVTIIKAVEPVILDQLFCETQGLVDLNTIVPQQFLGGTWSGQNTAGNFFNPSGLSGAYLLSYNAPSACALPTDVFVEIQSAGIPEMDNADWCFGAASLNLRTLEDSFYGGGTWFGPGVFGAIWDPIGQNSVTTLTYNSNTFCTNTVEINITLFDQVQVENLSVVCNGNEYSVSFNITGGNSDKLLVNGIASNRAFQFGPVPSDTSYRFEVSDSSLCSIVVLEGNKKCACFKDAGTMVKPVDTTLICALDTLRLFHNQDESLQIGDSLVFVLHDKSGVSLGKIFAINENPVFVKPNGIEYNRVYYVSSIAGEVSSDTINLQDPCFSISPGVPVVFYEPALSAIKDGILCSSDCTTYPVSFTGQPPYRAIVSWGYNNFLMRDTLVTQVRDTVLKLCPQLLPGMVDTILVKLEQISDNSCAGRAQLLGKLALKAPNIRVIDPVLCQNDSLVISGKVYNKYNPKDTIKIASLDPSICDTTLIIAPRFLEDATEIINRQLCIGQSILVNGQVYDETRPSGLEILRQAAISGCDSTVVINLTFGNQSLNELNVSLCRYDSLIINETVYNVNRITGQELLPGAAQGGCDSLINVKVKIIDEAIHVISPILCKGQSVTVNGVIYDENKPIGKEIISAGSSLGCDSIIDVALQYKVIDTTLLSFKICSGDSLVVNGTVFNEVNPGGFTVLSSASGCDSVLRVALEFENIPTGNLSVKLCKGDSILIGNTIFQEGKTSGNVWLEGEAKNGCDSLVMVKVDFWDEPRGKLNAVLCDGDTLSIAGNQFHPGKTSGTIVLPAASLNGCDSILDVSVFVLPVKEGYYETTLCRGDTLKLGNELFYEGKSSGQFIIPNASNEGCDSIVFVNILFNTPSRIDTLRLAAMQESEIFTFGEFEFSIDKKEGLVKLSETNVLGCDSLIYVSVSFPTDFRNLNWKVLPATCLEQNNGSFTLINAEGCEPEKLTINNVVYDIDKLPFDVLNLSPGVYNWKLESNAKCNSAGEFIIEGISAVGFEVEPTTVEVPIRSETLVNFLVSPEPFSAQWLDASGLSCNDCLSPIIEAPGSLLKYTLLLTDTNGCESKYNITVIPLETIKVWPNIIYPDGGGINSVFNVANEDNTLNAVFIYDRWGNALVSKNNFGNGESFTWDGTAANNRVSQGLYLISIQYKDGSTEWVEVTVL